MFKLPTWARIQNGAPNVFAVIGSIPWWRQQTWVAATEILAGFFAALGMVSGMSVSQVAAGMAIIYAVNATGVWLCRSYSWGNKAWGGLAWASWLGATLMAPHHASWWAMTMCIGALLAFRDQHTVRSLAAMAVRTERRRGKSARALTIASIFSAVFLGLALAGSGVAAMHWHWWAQIVALVACIAIVPDVIKSKSAAVRQPPAKPQEMDWLLRVSLTFNAINFLGRRIVLPGAFIAVASHYGDTAQALPLLGSALGLMGALGTLIRLPGSWINQMNGKQILLMGARASLIGWAFLATGILAWSHWPSAWVLVPTICGWALLELSHRSWSISFMDHLRGLAIGRQRTDARTHQYALQRCMIRKAFGGAAGCGVAALLPASLVPIGIVALVGGCWLVLGGGHGRDETNTSTGTA